MKKLAVIALALFSVSVIAQAANAETLVKQPQAALFVLDTSGKQPKLLEGTQLSRSKPRNLCIRIFDVAIQEQNMFAEYFSAPAPMNIVSKGSEIRVDEDKKGFLVVTNMNKADIKDNLITRCWEFTPQDPIGKYNVEVQFNDIVFKGLSFEILR
ncbi:hypothetical protein [Lonepinella sp. MS14436]|uniref:hypothetical protein n=1 Tax=Lonepinella sp. MS14436 TaxID=3003619 RepID=UPI0036DABC03